MNCFLSLTKKPLKIYFRNGGDFCFLCFLLFSNCSEQLLFVFSSPYFFVCSDIGFSPSTMRASPIAQIIMRWRMKMAVMLATKGSDQDRGDLSVSEWLWVWKPLVTEWCLERQGHGRRCREWQRMAVGWKGVVLWVFWRWQQWWHCCGRIIHNCGLTDDGGGINGYCGLEWERRKKKEKNDWNERGERRNIYIYIWLKWIWRMKGCLDWGKMEEKWCDGLWVWKRKENTRFYAVYVRFWIID